MKILLVEGDPHVLEVNRRLLTSLKHTVATANDASEAFLLHRQNTYDLIMVDREVTHAHGGIALIKSVRERDTYNWDVPICLTFAGVFDPNDAELKKHCSARNDFRLMKPFRMEEIQAVIGQANQLNQGRVVHSFVS